MKIHHKTRAVELIFSIVYWHAICVCVQRKWLYRPWEHGNRNIEKQIWLSTSLYQSALSNTRQETCAFAKRLKQMFVSFLFMCIVLDLHLIEYIIIVCWAMQIYQRSFLVTFCKNVSSSSIEMSLITHFTKFLLKHF